MLTYFISGVLLMILLYLLYKCGSRNFDYWKKRDIPYIPPVPFFGNFLDVAFLKCTLGEFLMNCHNHTPSPLLGMYIWNTPYLLIRNLDILKNVLITDFHDFENHFLLPSVGRNLEANMLFMLKSSNWRQLRTKLRPFFSVARMKIMVPHMSEKAELMIDYIRNQSKNTVLEARDVCGKYAIDALTKCAYSINAHSFDNEKAEFRNLSRQMFVTLNYVTVQQMCLFFGHTLAKILRMKFFPVHISKFMQNVIQDLIRTRERSNEKGSDVIHLIMQMKKDEEFCKELAFYGDKPIALAAQIYFSGFETVSSSMSFAVYELCIHPEIQMRARLDVYKNLEKYGSFTYEAIENMKYLHKCFFEALRKYPPIPFLEREANTTYTIPGTNLTIEKGQRILFSNFGLHYDPQYYPDPDKFNPDRFDENSNFHSSDAFQAFGQGPRSCIGERFGIYSAKVGLAHLIANFHLDEIPETPKRIQFSKRTLMLVSSFGIPLKFRYISATERANILNNVNY